MPYTNFPDGITAFGIPLFGGGLPPFTGKHIFVNPAIGSDGNTGDADSPLDTLGAALALCTAGNNDVVYLVGDGSTAGTARLSANLAWNKRATHLIGVAAPTALGNRARIAPTAAVTAFANMITVSVSGCIFANLSVFHGFDTGTTSQIAWTDTGGRNYYSNVQFGGMGDAASAQNTGSRSLKISGTTGENTFDNCVIGLDTVARTVANASLEFAGGTPRNIFRNCMFPFFTSNAGVLGILGTGAACMDRWQTFENCSFINAIKSTSTTMTVLASLTSASPGGLMLFKNPTLVGITDFGDTNGLANSYVDGGPPAAATTGIAVNPS